MREIHLRSIWFPLILCLSLPSLAMASDLPPESHPSILYDSSMVETILERIERPPYSGWWAGVQTMANQGLNFNFSGATEAQKSLYCKVLAFAYSITDSIPYAQKCLEGLELIDPDGNWGAELHTQADPLLLYCEAYDMLKGSGYNLGTSDELVRELIAQKAQEFRDNYFILIYTNNWRVRYLSALGVAALTLADHPAAEDWHDWTEQWVRQIFDDFQVVGEGAWAEGPYYLLYSAHIYLPYMLAFHRLISGTDLINEANIRLVHEWDWKIRLPNGQRPNYEDSHLTYFFSDYLATVYDSGGIYQWDFTAVPDSIALYAQGHEQVDAICYFDDIIEATLPEIDATIYLPEAGNMIFRSGWGLDDIYLLLTGEHGEARIFGQGHDHPDATSFILYAYGEMLCLDAGYISWDQREAVNQAKSHSLILVDGEGPPGPTLISAGDADAYLTKFYNIGRLQFCEDSTFYREVSIKRSVLFVDSAFFLIRDQVASPDLHTYNWRLHGNGGGTSSGDFQLNDNGATWTRDHAELHVVMGAENPLADVEQALSYSTTVDTHSFAYNQILTHNTLDARITGGDVDFLVAIYPVVAGSPSPALERLPFDHGIAIRLEEGIALSSAGDYPIVLPEVISGFDDIKTDADWFYAGISGGEMLRHDLHGCSGFSYGGTTYFWSDDNIAFALERSGDYWRGHVSGDEFYSLHFYCDSEPTHISFNGSSVDFSYRDSMVWLELSEDGYLDIYLEPQQEPLAYLSNQADDQVIGHTNLSVQPNPFNSRTKIHFTLTEAARVNLSVYDVSGRLIAPLMDGRQEAGTGEMTIDAIGLASGVYLARLQTGDQTQTQKLVLVR